MHHVGGCGSTAESGSAAVRWSSCLPCLIIRLIIQTIRRDRSGAVQTDDPSNVSRPDPSGADQIDAEHQATDLVRSASWSYYCLPTGRARACTVSLSTEPAQRHDRLAVAAGQPRRHRRPGLPVASRSLTSRCHSVDNRRPARAREGCAHGASAARRRPGCPRPQSRRPPNRRAHRRSSRRCASRGRSGRRTRHARPDADDCWSTG
jgi:hypothetical protein